MGGTGKTPHTAFLTKYLNDYLNVATLSRGYGRRTVGFRWVNPEDSSKDVGDEPLLLKQRFPDIPVAVGENRVLAIPRMVGEYHNLQTILLDDAYQHFPLQAGFYTLLTSYYKPFDTDYYLPVGTLRESRDGAKRANLVIVTQCPADLSENEARILRKRLSAYCTPNTPIFFSTYSYQAAYSFFNPLQTLPYPKSETDVILLSGIAQTKGLEDYLTQNFRSVNLQKYPDHHEFTPEEIGRLKVNAERLKSSAKNLVILTTEKDAMRLEPHRAFLEAANIEVFVLPIDVNILFNEESAFFDIYKSWLLNFKA